MKNELLEEIARLANKKKLKYEDIESSVYNAIFEIISSEIGSKKPRQLLFHAMHSIQHVPMCKCGSKLSWHDDYRQYRKYCSKRCTALYTVHEKKQKLLEAEGIEWHSQRSDWKEKTKRTSIERFGEDHYSKTSEHTERMREANLKKFGVSYPAQSKKIQTKIKNTCIEKYGVDNPAKVEQSKIKSINTSLKLYGVPNPSKKHYSQEANELINNNQLFIQLCETHSIRDLANQYQISVKPLYDKAKKLKLVLPKFNTSTFEKEITNYIQNIYDGRIELGTFAVLKNRQIDIYLPELNVAIECNGTYWHSESRGRGSKYHIDKTNRCAAIGIELIHIWEHDWYSKQDIIKSQLAYLVHQSHKIPARKTIIKNISKCDANTFLETTHIQGKLTCDSINLGLFYNDELVSVMSFGKSRFHKKYQWELLRFANKLGTTVVGGASKLFSYFIKSVNPASILSYSDISRGSGKVYKILRFTHTGKTKPSYKYTKNYVTTHSRYKFQKHKLKKLPEYSEHLTENQIMKKNGYDRIWDCGNDIFVWAK